MRHFLPVLILLAASSGHTSPISSDSSIHPSYLPIDSSEATLRTPIDELAANEYTSESLKDDCRLFKAKSSIPQAYAYLLTLWGLAEDSKDESGSKTTKIVPYIINSPQYRRSCEALFGPSYRSSPGNRDQDPLNVDRDINGLLSRICERSDIPSSDLSIPSYQLKFLVKEQWERDIGLFYLGSDIHPDDIMKGGPYSKAYLQKMSKAQINVKSLRREIAKSFTTEKCAVHPKSSILLRTVIKAFIASMLYHPPGHSHASNGEAHYVTTMKRMALVSHLAFWKSTFPTAYMEPVFKAILQKISNDPTINRLNPTIMDMAKAIYTSSAPLSQTSGMERQGSSKPKMPRRNTLNAETRLSVAQSSKRPQYLDVKSSSMISPSITHAQVHGEKVQISSSTSSRTSSSSFDESKRSSSSVAESEKPSVFQSIKNFLSGKRRTSANEAPRSYPELRRSYHWGPADGIYRPYPDLIGSS
ncbi:MAG: hypothetical protein DHS80DRAFT_31737 [Piptocephalis tieghemiana]|nr:MAG: hypothetical protein DHS80DRAFT_31737 [Piptocephalis tieghemiana]